jgi:hypothetical protein
MYERAAWRWAVRLCGTQPDTHLSVPGGTYEARIRITTGEGGGLVLPYPLQDERSQGRSLSPLSYLVSEKAGDEAFFVPRARSTAEPVRRRACARRLSSPLRCRTIKSIESLSFCTRLRRPTTRSTASPTATIRTGPRGMRTGCSTSRSSHRSSACVQFEATSSPHWLDSTASSQPAPVTSDGRTGTPYALRQTSRPRESQPTRPVISADFASGYPNASSRRTS